MRRECLAQDISCLIYQIWFAVNAMASSRSALASPIVVDCRVALKSGLVGVNPFHTFFNMLLICTGLTTIAQPPTNSAAAPRFA
jgi:hypothetical protein